MQESELYGYWAYYANSGESIKWQKNCLKIFNAGILNEHNGPDFKFARFELNGVTYQGAVEFHINIDDWYRHKHHYDPEYRDVVLHIVATTQNIEKKVIHNLSNRSIPTFLLPKPKIEYNKASCVRKKTLTSSQIKSRLQQLALQRLKLKVQSFSKSLKTNSEHALFYQGFFRVLGYPFNKDPFEMLSLKVPQSLYEQNKKSPGLLAAIYFGCSGFLQERFKDGFARQLKIIFNQYEKFLSSSIINIQQWQFSAIRPHNHPHFRIAAWIAFITSIQNQSPFNYVYHILEQRLSCHDTYDKLLKILMLKTTGYWREHYALDKQTKEKKNNFYLGQARIHELIINLILPLSISIAYKNNNLGFATFLEEFYLWLPGKCNYSSLFRKSPWLLEYKNIWRSCNTGQALLYLNDIYCSRNQCSKCPLERQKQFVRSTI